MKKVLILGANPETVSLIIKAKEMGIFTIVTDNNPNAFAKKYADMAINIDAIDVLWKSWRSDYHLCSVLQEGYL